jgi:hypothetical protein
VIGIENGTRLGNTFATSASSRISAADLPPSSKLAREPLGCDGRDVLAGGRTAREADLVDARMANQVFTGLAPGRNHVEHARRDAGRFHALGEDVGVGRCLGRGLSDHRAACRKTCRRLVAEEDQRRVPGRDRGADADGLLDYAHVLPMHAAALVDERVRLNELAVICEEIGRLRGQIRCEADRGAHLRGPRGRELG